MDFDFAHVMLTGGMVEKENSGRCSPSKDAYRKHLAEILNMNRTRILSFRNKPPPSANGFQESFLSAPQLTPSKRRRHIPQVGFLSFLENSERTLDAPDLLDDFYLNLLDWGVSNILAIALGNVVYLWDPSNGSPSELVNVDDEIGPVTSIRWAPDGRSIAVGLNNSHVQVWDSSARKLLRTFREGHILRVGSLDWNSHILTTGGSDASIVNNDVRIRSHIVGTYTGHSQEVCGLKWSESGRQLASGGNDNLLFVWNIAMASTNSANQWLYRLTDHRSAVKALSWCPFQSNLLSSGGGVGDHSIKFWNTHTGRCLNSVDTGSQVCCLLWNKHERELLSSHGFNKNELILWKYPSMVKLAELYGHSSRVLYMTQSPSGYTVASAAADETLKLWNVFGNPDLAKPALKEDPEPFANLARTIR
ncbi:hypothetical protein RJ639_030416 [Escallonia herrerae]|uniref:CDC20/Fizzy WD40 domain-containing protein n=1 Tax=Escallonia herrerae TaxID=1293975 RepID=A0AA88X2W0_9ASTE|nr:hypothetical protein RJ639_030416 [Escallonia herrerae]